MFAVVTVKPKTLTNLDHIYVSENEVRGLVAGRSAPPYVLGRYESPERAEEVLDSMIKYFASPSRKLYQYRGSAVNSISESEKVFTMPER